MVITSSMSTQVRPRTHPGWVGPKRRCHVGRPVGLGQPRLRAGGAGALQEVGHPGDPPSDRGFAAEERGLVVAALAQAGAVERHRGDTVGIQRGDARDEEPRQGRREIVAAAVLERVHEGVERLLHPPARAAVQVAVLRTAAVRARFTVAPRALLGATGDADRAGGGGAKRAAAVGAEPAAGGELALAAGAEGREERVEKRAARGALVAARCARRCEGGDR